MCVEIGCNNGITYVKIGCAYFSPRIDRYELIRVEIEFFTSLHHFRKSTEEVESQKLVNHVMLTHMSRVQYTTQRS
jgi:hypothetical protein